MSDVDFCEPFACGGGNQVGFLKARCVVVRSRIEIHDVTFGGLPLDLIMGADDAQTVIAFIESETRKKLTGQPSAEA